MIGNQYYKKAPPLLYVEKISKDTFNEHILQKEHHDDYDHKKVQEEDLGLEMGFFAIIRTPIIRTTEIASSFLLTCKRNANF